MPKADSHAEQEIGDYELHGKLGSGGMGIVYRARQKSTDRIVALKLIRSEQLETLSDDRRQAWLDRFRTEAQTAARLEHDHVVTIYDVGDVGGKLYYSMQYIEGQSLAEVVRDGPMENRRAAGLMHRVALAVDHAHRQGVLHRDLKPQNILIRQVPPDAAGASASSDSSSSSAWDVLDGERPYVADFGLAKCLEEGADGTTHTGEVMGSPSYMSPEQANDASRCTPSSDIYSLGATLYDLLTGRPPFRAFSPLETLRQVIDQDPVTPRDLNAAIDLDLQTITLKALAKEPSRRYETSAAMASDLQRYLKGEPIEARPISTVERVLRWCRRNPVVAMLAAGVATLLMVVVFGSIVYSFRLSQHAKREGQARNEAETYFRMSLNVIDEMLTDFGDESLAHVPQMESVRKDLLRKALVLHQQLLSSKPSNRALQVEFARTQHRIGNLHKLLGEHDEAAAAYERAIRLFGDLHRETPFDRNVSHYLAISHTMLGEILRKILPASARQSYESALTIQDELLRLDAEDSNYVTERCRTLNNLALLLTETGQHEAARSALVDAIAQSPAFVGCDGCQGRCGGGSRTLSNQFGRSATQNAGPRGRG